MPLACSVFVEWFTCCSSMLKNQVLAEIIQFINDKNNFAVYCVPSICKFLLFKCLLKKHIKYFEVGVSVSRKLFAI